MIFEPCPDQFQSLRSRPVAEYFSEDSLAPTSMPLFDKDDLHDFAVDFEKLLKHRRAFQGLSRTRTFRAWWHEHREAYVTRPLVKEYRASGMTMGELLDDAHLHFALTQERRKNSSLAVRAFRRVFRSRMPLLIVFAVSFLAQKSGSFLWSLLVLGPGVQMVNSYTQTAITPLAQTAQQKGSKDLGTAAETIQGWLTGNGEDAVKVRDELRATTERLQSSSFSHLDAEQVEQKWAEFEQSYFQIFLKYSQTLPTHLRDGRAYMRDTMLMTPVYLAGSLASFDTQYWMHRNALMALKNKSGSEAKVHRVAMKAAEDRIAGALAAWKMYEFMYPELAGDPVNAKARGELGNAYRTFASSMRFDVYVHHFVDEMTLLLKQLDSEFLVRRAG